MCDSLSAKEVRALARAGVPFVAGLAELDVPYVDLPTSNWPMLTEPEELARVPLTAAR